MKVLEQAAFSSEQLVISNRRSALGGSGSQLDVLKAEARLRSPTEI